MALRVDESKKLSNSKFDPSFCFDKLNKLEGESGDRDMRKNPDL